MRDHMYKKKHFLKIAPLTPKAGRFTVKPGMSRYVARDIKKINFAWPSLRSMEFYAGPFQISDPGQMALATVACQGAA